MMPRAQMSLSSLSLHPVRAAGWREVLLAGIALAVALLAISRLVPLYGLSVAALLTVPIAVLAWSFGLKGALIGSVLALPAGMYVCLRGTAEPMLLQVVSGHLGIMLIACVTGRLRDLSVRIGRELEEHARAVRLLRHSEARNQALLSALPDLIFRLDANGKVGGASGARGRASSMRSATYLDQLIPAEAAELMRARAAEVLRSGEPGELEYNVSEDDDSRDYEARLVKCDRDQVLVIVRNVTRQKRLERELIAAKEAALDAARSKTKFLASMSHEIRTPMNGVIGMTNLLLETALGQEQREYAQIIQKSGQALLMIIDDILDFAKIEAGRLELDCIAFDLHACLEDSVAAFSGQAHAKGLDLGCVFERRVPRRVIGDPTRLRQVLANLLGNAVKYTESGQVKLLVACDELDAEGLLRFSVIDTGPGISPELDARLFRPLLLGEAGPGAVREGTGLGLAIARELVQLMGGEIHHESKLGEGATFTFTARLARAPSEDDEETDLTGARVLVVRPRGSERRLLDEQLESLGIDITRASEQNLVSLLEGARAAGRSWLAVLVEGGRDPQADEQAMTLARRNDSLPVVLLLPTEARGGHYEELRRSATRVLSWPLARSELVGCLSALLGRGDAVAAEAPTPARLNARVLIAEDNLINQRVAQRTLELMGCTSEVVDDGRAAVEATLTGRFDIVLMDCQIPVMDRFEASRQIRARETERRTPIVAMTAGVADSERERWREAGMDAYVTKPIGVEQLRDTIAKLLRVGEPAVAAEDVLDGAALDELRELGDADFLRELVRLFIEQAPRNLEVARAALDVGDLEAAAKAAHTIKSSSGYLGARRLTKLSLQLEQRARAGEGAEVGRALEALTAEYDVVRQALLGHIA